MPPQLGIFGGTFDPPHVGHVTAAIRARDQLAADILHVVVAHDPWQKSGRRSVTPSHHRLAMARLAFDGLSGIEVSNAELERDGPSYMIDTVMELERPGTETVLVMGPATAAGLSTWHRADELAQRVTIAVIQPTGVPRVRLGGWRATAVFMAPVAASATWVRELLEGSGGPETAAALDRLVPRAVMGYIADHKLYSA
ncbi:nicotinate-nicotinamide nucleotide adenylyltransferase [Candidatus Poriferisodalis sp.]|uniref:nicotinate-nicotinamide nucleotide adenylyltransferase n=1 Tax=Candidatus Poriferisodalis sp. TaxID=3101277 RepID=UPI003B021F45